MLNKGISSPLIGVKGVECFLSIDSKLRLLKETELCLNSDFVFIFCESLASLWISDLLTVGWKDYMHHHEGQ